MVCFRYIIVNTPHKGDNKTEFSSVQFTGCLLTCKLNSRIAYYKARTKTHNTHKRVQIHKNKPLKKQKKEYMAEKSNKKELRQKP
jgi:hypothetical protein